MPRNTGGVFTLPNTPFVSGTVIQTYPMNSNFADITLALTESLSRTGAGAMLAPLRLVDGTASTPALSFSGDTSSGLYRPSANLMGVGIASTLIQQWAPTGSTMFRPLVITAGVSNGTALTATGNGTGAGVVANGGGAGGLAISGTGGLSISGTAMDANGTVQPTRYAFGFSPIPAVSGANYPLAALSTFVTGGNTSSFNARVESINTVSSWTHVRFGLSFDVDSVIGAGGSLWFGSDGFTLRTLNSATPTTPLNALSLGTGYLNMATPANPNSNVAFTDTITPRNFDKTTASITVQSGTATVADGFSISSAQVVPGTPQVVRLTFAAPFASANYQVTLSPDAGASGANMFNPGFLNKTTTTVDVRGYVLSTGAAIDFSGATIYRFDIRISGAQ